MTLRAIFSRKWIIPTILVVLGMIGLVRLGFWQLDRLHQKQAYNALLAERWKSAPFDLNANALPSDLAQLEYRRVQAQGQWDYEHQMLVQQAGGYVVVTPLVLGDSRAVLVARGWVPADMLDSPELAQLTEPAGAPVIGLARQSQSLRGEVSTPAATAQPFWYRIDIPAMQGQVPYKLEPAYLEQLPEAGRSENAMPMRSNPTPLDEGNHLSYAIQWFTFALVLGFGYIMLVRFRTRLAAGLVKPPQPVAPLSAGPEPGAGHGFAEAAAPLAGPPIDGPPARAAAIQPDPSQPNASQPADAELAAQPEPILAGEQPRSRQ